MYTVERVLQELKFKKTAEYDSGVIVYSDEEAERGYTTEVALFTKHTPQIFEITMRSPYGVTLASNREPEYERLVEMQKSLVEEFVARACGLREELMLLEPFEEWNND